ncbi:hypothetical protein LAZ67_5002506 [Cordylochernes scorpioides]|uniref:Reverse transcriptase domain-containing protein n=1 Tax=Cordylochernes scorpioides TaxID=51811 RepID=A0ABY6KJD7_9ARAC|nr:hypothetical protein LAZ67_5002506 [Cordylochernes scorpioides]
MNLVLGDLLYKCVRLYIDDIIVYSDSQEQHVTDLAAVLERLSRFNLKAKLRKSYFFKALTNLNRPHNIKGIRSLLGTVNYYRRFIPNADSRIVDLKRLILNSQSYEEEFAKQLLETLIEEREQTERAERERMEQTAQTEQAERERKGQMEFELEKLRIQTMHGDNDPSRGTSNNAHCEIRKLMPKYESKDSDLSF